MVRPRISERGARNSQTNAFRTTCLPSSNTNKQFLYSPTNVEAPLEHTLSHNPLLNHDSPMTNTTQTNDNNANNLGILFDFSFQMNQSSADKRPRSFRNTTLLAECGSVPPISDRWTAIFSIMPPSWRLRRASSAFCLLEIRGKCFECLRAFSYWGLVKTAIASRTDLSNHLRMGLDQNGKDGPVHLDRDQNRQFSLKSYKGQPFSKSTCPVK